ncbi:hypothetical protein KIN20_036220 [Parelaphostrongylus tenuis]|uniref:Mos1 transposase HTH domain-containing protein n=1 Tax=Parelaphostrongylus tenuis TaxID=148309 RepID=A0AAD5RCW5_PARTN|nr:hypothetical protein KIN20_036220 [Parelaphostrongylus tenuis]
MELTSEQIMLLMMHKWLLGSNAMVTGERINLIWGEDTVAKSTVYGWFKKFDECEESLEDQPRSGRPKEVGRQLCLKQFEENHSLTTHSFLQQQEMGI